MDVPKAVLTITKTDGAIRQVEAAIQALQRGDFDIAVTLAGASEGMFDRRGPHMWNFILNSPKAAEFEKKELISVLNAARDWLKHPTTDVSEVLTLTRGDAAFMIARAASKLETWSPLIEDFKSWLVANLDTL